jgi:hypothetical protein
MSTIAPETTYLLPKTFTLHELVTIRRIERSRPTKSAHSGTSRGW